MKILQVNNYHYLRGGAERVYFETSKLLEEQGHDVIHFSVADSIAFDSPYTKYFLNPVDFNNSESSLSDKARLLFRFIYSKEAQIKIESLITRERPTVAHLHIFYGRLTSSILPVIRKYRIPAVMTVHEYRMLCPVYTLVNSNGTLCEKCANGNYLHCVFNKCNKKNITKSIISALECYSRDHIFPYENYIHTFIMVSKFIMNKHLQFRPRMKNKYQHIYNFVNTEDFVPRRSPGDYFLYSGRLSNEKGLITMLIAWKNFPDVKLKLAGQGPLQREIAGILRNNNLNNVELIGYKTGEELINLIRYSKYVIVASEWYETFGLSIVESFACGKPVIASRIGAIPELVEDGVNGFLFEGRDVESLIKTIHLVENISEDKYIEMSRNARAFVEKRFNKDIYYGKLMQVYEQALQYMKKFE